MDEYTICKVSFIGDEPPDEVRVPGGNQPKLQLKIRTTVDRDENGNERKTEHVMLLGDPDDSDDAIKKRSIKSLGFRHHDDASDVSLDVFLDDKDKLTTTFDLPADGGEQSHTFGRRHTPGWSLTITVRKKTG